MALTALAVSSPDLVIEVTHSGTEADEATDLFARIGSCSPAEVERLAAILELRGVQAGQVAFRAAMFAAAGIGSGAHVAEVGCGTGVVARQLAAIAGPTGAVVGIDPSPALLAYARLRRSARGAPIVYDVGDAYHLAEPPARFDATVSVTLLSHLARPAAALAEMRRVTRPGGVVLAIDQDYGTLVIDHDDLRLTQRILTHALKRHILDPWCGRGLHRRLAAAGLVEVDGVPHVYAERDGDAYLITVAQRIAAIAEGEGAISSDEARRWLAELAARSAAGEFHASLNYYAAWGRVAP